MRYEDKHHLSLNMLRKFEAESFIIVSVFNDTRKVCNCRPVSSTIFTFPINGFSVVNYQIAILGRAMVVAARNVDLLMLGKLTKPISARFLNQNRSILFSTRLTCLFSKVTSYAGVAGCLLRPQPRCSFIDPRLNLLKIIIVQLILSLIL